MTLQIVNRTRMYQSSFLDFDGGVRNSVSDEMILPNELSSVSNFLPDRLQSGVLIKRPGVTRKTGNQKSEAFSSVFDGYQADWYSTLTAVYNIASDSSASMGSLTSTKRPDWTRFDDASHGKIDIFVNGTERKKYTSSWSNLANIPANVKFVESYNRFVFAAGHDAGKLRWSDPEDAETWNSAHELIFDDDITGIKRFGSQLAVFCDKSLHFIRGYDEDRMDVIASHRNVGCTSHQSIVVCRFGMYWWGDQGMMWMDNQGEIRNPSMSKIPATIAGLEPTEYSNIHGIFNPNEECIKYWVTKSGGSAADRNIVYYPEMTNPSSRNTLGKMLAAGEERLFGAFFVGDGDGVEMAASGVVDESGDNKIYLGTSASSGYLYEETGNTDDGTPISAYIETQRETGMTGSGQLGEEVIKRLHLSVPMFIITGAASASYGIYLDDSLVLKKEWDLTLDTTEGFILDTDALGAGRLGAGAAYARSRVGKRLKWRKLKHRIFDSSAFRTRIRGLIQKGRIISA